MLTMLDRLTEGMKQPADAEMDGVAFVDGTFMPANEACVPLLDWGLTRSDAFQETVSFWGGYFFRLDDHVERFYRSADRLRMTPPPEPELRAVIHGLVQRGKYRAAYIQVLMTRGVPPVGSRDVRSCINRFRAYAIPYVWIAPPDLQANGLKLHLSDRQRIPRSAVDPLVKHYHWLDFQMGLLDAYDRGCDTVALRDVDGCVAEGPGFNVFAATGGRLYTPPAIHVLDGMTRRTIIELATILGIAVEERSLPDGDLDAADEVFLTSTAGGVLPVSAVNGKPVGDGTVGDMTDRLHTEYWSRRSEGWHGTPLEPS